MKSVVYLLKDRLSIFYIINNVLYKYLDVLCGLFVAIGLKHIRESVVYTIDLF